MNRKREEELMQLAFGDLRREECRTFAGEIDSDPESAKAYGAYCEMREGLKALRDIPEMQLSTERLRDAILREGLAPKRTPRWSWNWLATPLAVGACAFVIVTAMNKQDSGSLPGEGSGGLVVKNMGASPDTVVSLGGNDRLRNDLLNVGPFDFGDPVAEVAPKPVGFEASVSDKPARPAVRRPQRLTEPRREKNAGAVETRAVPGLALALAAQPTTPTLDEREVAVMTAAPSIDTFRAETSFRSTGASDIVQIDSRVDSESGAARAVEVKGTQNVEIGG